MTWDTPTITVPVAVWQDIAQRSARLYLDVGALLDERGYSVNGDLTPGQLDNVTYLDAYRRNRTA